jgi:hypothetical protein
MTTTSSLGAVAEVREPVRGRHLSKLRIGWCDPEPCDCYAPAPKRCVCVSRAGRPRRDLSGQEDQAMSEWVMAHPVMTFCLGVFLLMTVDNVIGNICRWGITRRVLQAKKQESGLRE